MSALWYALHVRSCCESAVAAQLTDAGVEAFYPFKATKSKDGKHATETKFMPGYVFGRFRLAEKTPVIAIAQVVSILGCGSRAVAIPDVEIEAVKLIMHFPELAMPCPFVNAGDRVRVAHGPLRGLEGYVVFAKSAARVIVSVSMLGRSISAEVDIDSLEMLRHASAAA